MKKETSFIDLELVKSQLFTESIGCDLILLDDINNVPFFDHPTKIDEAVVTICLKGYAKGSINLKPCTYSANDFFIVLPGQIVQYSYKSADFEGMFFIVSKRFTDNLELNAKELMPVFLYLKENPVMHLNREEIMLILNYCNFLKKAIQMTRNPQRMEIVRLLAQAFFYSVWGFQQSRQEYRGNKPKREALFDAFYNLVLQHYKDSREVGFYANKLCLTPKYLSAIIKEFTGNSALGWINDYVILEAKSLLKSTNMTIQQISNELNFPSQSFFGKYFKRLVGVSPKAYRSI
jgi:AraC-like DNA-binding protein